VEASSPNLNYLIELMKQKSGIVFTPEKSYIMLTKLYPLLEKHKMNDIDHLLQEIKLKNNPILISDVIDSLTVNETSFYRDRYPFEVLNNYVIPHIKRTNPEKKSVKILCAACSTGQEPYSIIMHFLEHTEYQINCHITAIDLSHQVISKAKSGLYNQFEIQRGLPITLLVKYFSQVEKNWLIKDEVKEHVNFKQFNLMSDLSLLGKFDIIFCRNVLIYFDEQTRKQAINNLKTLMQEGSTLILGATEFIPWEDNQLKKVTEYNAIYNFQS
jgi:chemotaxis protein methyltransferase CheR